jgi:hypothetical protein
MEAHADQFLRYLVATKDLGILFDGRKGPELKAFSDSDWSTVHSTTGIVLMLAGASVSYASKRQQSIALSSCEAEIMAASVAATETVYVSEILRDLGLPQLQPTTPGVDNKGAIELAKECKITHQSRHITRRHLKIGEYTHDEIIDVKWVPTLLNISDLFSHLTRAPSYGTATRLCSRCISWRRMPCLTGRLCMPNPSMPAWAEYACRYGSTRHLQPMGVLRPEAYSVAHIVDLPARLARGAIE